MPHIEISAEIHRQTMAFKPLAEAVLRERMDNEAYFNFLLYYAAKELLSHAVHHRIPQPDDPNDDKSFITLSKIAEFEPEKVYGLIAIVYERIFTELEREAQREQQELKDILDKSKRRIGFSGSDPSPHS